MPLDINCKRVEVAYLRLDASISLKLAGKKCDAFGVRRKLGKRYWGKKKPGHLSKVKYY